jgi:hypothetical protein
MQRLTSGGLDTIRRFLVNWTSKKQPIMGLPSCKAELIACVERAQAGRFAQQPMGESIGYEPATVIFEDNAECVFLM